jgi:exopolysaccharide biosynthesis polyprenyl glycosylphosphotransferase
VTSPAIIRTEPSANWAVLGSQLRTIPQRKRERRGNQRNVLIVGSGAAGRKLAAYLEQHAPTGCLVCGFVDNTEPIGGDVLGTVDDLARIARARFVDEVILTAPYQRDLASRVVLESRRNGLAVKVIPDLLGLEPKSVTLDWVGDLPVLKLRGEPVPALRFLLKRAADVVLSLVGLVALAPVLAAVALVIKLDSPGPVFYRARRMGKKGKTFLCYKFRTMVNNADEIKELLRRYNEREGPIFKIACDPRVTHMGKFLRRYSLDELPQLWNVLRGEMSLVGPRPHPLDDFERYALEHLRRLEVTPGITGLWQVTARRDPSFQRNMALDLEYIEHWSLWLDLRILCKTVSAVVQGSGT